MSLSNLPIELIRLITDFCSEKSALNFSLSSRSTYKHIYMVYPRLFSTRIKREIYYLLQGENLLSSAKYKRSGHVDDGGDDNCPPKKKKKSSKVGNEEEETTSQMILRQFQDLSNFVKEKKEFMASQEMVKGKLFSKWSTFLNKSEFLNGDEKKQLIVENEIFSKFILKSHQVVVAGDFRKNYYLSGKIGDSNFHFEAYDESDGGESTQWSITLEGKSLANFSSDESFLYQSVAKKYLKKINLKVSMLDLIEILIQLQPWFFEIGFKKYRLSAIME